MMSRSATEIKPFRANSDLGGNLEGDWHLECLREDPRQIILDQMALGQNI